MSVIALCTSLFVGCDDDDNIKKLPNEIKDFIAQKYPNSTIIEFDTERVDIEVDILHDNIKKDVTFSKKNVWLSTSWDFPVLSLTQIVKDAVTAAHPTLRIDDVDYYQTPQNDYYLIELEPGDLEIKVKEDGVII